VIDTNMKITPVIVRVLRTKNAEEYILALNLALPETAVIRYAQTLANSLITIT